VDAPASDPNVTLASGGGPPPCRSLGYTSPKRLGNCGPSDGTGRAQRSFRFEVSRDAVARHARRKIQIDFDLRVGRRRSGDIDRLHRCGQSAVEPRRTAAEGDHNSRIAGRRAMAYCAAVAIREPRVGRSWEFGWDRGGTIAVGASD